MKQVLPWDMMEIKPDWDRQLTPELINSLYQKNPDENQYWLFGKPY